MKDSASCNICSIEIVDEPNHKNSFEHRFNFHVWSFKEYRKSLVKNRHGIEFLVEPETNNNVLIHSLYEKNQGNHIVQILPEQFQLNNNSVTFHFTIKNTSNESIYLTSFNLLHPSSNFEIICNEEANINSEPNLLLKLLPGALYNFRVKFFTEQLHGSYEIPLACDLQTEKNQYVFTIVRSIIVAENLDEYHLKGKSPFTGKPWTNVTEWIPSNAKSHYVDKYNIPKEYKRILRRGLKPFSSMNSEDNQMLNQAMNLLQNSVSVTEDNYQNFWHFSLWLEEITQTTMLKGYNMENVKMEVKNGNILSLEVPGLAEKRPSVIVGDMINIRFHDDCTSYSGNVRKVYDTTVDISDVNDVLVEVLQDHPNEDLDVQFVLSRLSFERMHEAVDKVVARGLVSSLFPFRTEIRPSFSGYKLKDSDFYNKNILENEMQKTAVTKILNSRQNLPYIIFGPPGTGKTMTIVEAILQIKKHTEKRILVCAPSNAACDMITTKLIDHCDQSELIRIHSNTRETLAVTEPIKEYSNMSEDDEGFQKLPISQIMSYRIVVTTLTLIGRYRDYKTDCVFVDEAAQASEPETVIPLSFLGKEKLIVLAGDPKQLGPMIQSTCAIEYGLEKSLLERLMNYSIYQPDPDTRTYNSDFITMLVNNYRSDPDILRIPNLLFYDNCLIPVIPSATRDPIANVAVYPLIYRWSKKSTPPGQATEFCSVSFKEKREGSSPSYFNPAEANMVIKYVTALVNLNLPCKVLPEDIGVITPYKRQVYKIKHKLKYSGFDNVEVGTTESFQGREKRVIVISTVRAQRSLLLHDRKYNLGFVRNDQRFNVAITRARSKLIVIGCQPVLITDPKWKSFIEQCQEMKSYFGAPYVERTKDFKDEVINRMKNVQQVDGQKLNRP